MNERTHFFVKINISHTLFSKGLMFLWCVRDEWRDTHSERGLLLFISSSGSQGVPTLTLPCKLIGDASGWLRVPRSTAILCTLSIFFHYVHLLPLLLPLIYTGASLIDGSVKGQYITNI